MAQPQTVPLFEAKPKGPSPRVAGPFLKWAGGKTQLLPTFASLYPAPGACKRFIEPFLGSGAVFFHVNAVLGPRKALLFDNNRELVLTYRAIAGDVDAVLAELHRHRNRHGREHYYEVRARETESLSDAQRAARLIYLNKTCYNGLYRVNSKNQFNVPMGRYERPSIFDEDNLRAVARALARVRVEQADFRKASAHARTGDFVYFDPPYDPVSRTAYFTSYTQARFEDSDQEALAEVFRTLAERGCRVMLSNSDTRFVRKLYRGFHIHTVRARRTINTRPDKRGHVNEVVVTNYEPGT